MQVEQAVIILKQSQTSCTIIIGEISQQNLLFAICIKFDSPQKNWGFFSGNPCFLPHPFITTNSLFSKVPKPCLALKVLILPCEIAKVDQILRTATCSSLDSDIFGALDFCGELEKYNLSHISSR